MNKQGTCTVGFLGQSVTIRYNGHQAKSLIEFLCSDLLTNVESTARPIYEVIIVGKKPMMSLWKGDTKLYFGSSSHRLAYLLINEIIYQCIINVDRGHAVHAAAVGCNAGGILLPGKSGAGKSTLTAWLTAIGCDYLTDELVVLSGENSQIHPFIRPLSIKKDSIPVLSTFLDIDLNEVLAGEKGLMVPHRLLNDRFTTHVPSLSHILFPEYKEGAKTTITELSSGLACSRLIECYVNARNIEGHGISQLAALTKRVPAFKLTYGSFDALYEALLHSFPEIFNNLSSKMGRVATS